MERIEYSKNMKKSLELVERTREKRLELTLERMNLRDNEELLKKWHPDYKKEATRPIRIGPNKGEPLIAEVGDLLEAYPLAIPEKINLSKKE